MIRHRVVFDCPSNCSHCFLISSFGARSDLPPQRSCPRNIRRLIQIRCSLFAPLPLAATCNTSVQAAIERCPLLHLRLAAGLWYVLGQSLERPLCSATAPAAYWEEHLPLLMPQPQSQRWIPSLSNRRWVRPIFADCICIGASRSIHAYIDRLNWILSCDLQPSSYRDLRH